MSKRKTWYFTLGTILLFLLLFCVRITGAAIHCILGGILVVISLVHFLGQKKKVPYMQKGMKLLDISLTLVMLLLIVSGVLVHIFSGIFLWKIVHKVSSVLFLLGIILHLWQHRSYFKR